MHEAIAYDLCIVLTHASFRVDAAVIWETVKSDLPRWNTLVKSLPGCCRAEKPGSVDPLMRKEGAVMNASIEQTLISKIRMLSSQQVAEVEDFVEFLAAKAGRSSALDRLLSIAPALEAAGAAQMTDEEITAEVKAARAERRTKAGNVADE